MNASNVLVLGGSRGVIGGVERYASRLVSSLSEYGGVTSRWKPLYDCMPSRRAALRAGRELPRLISGIEERESTLIWYQHGNGFDPLLLGLLRSLWKGPLVVTCHVSDRWRHLQSPMGKAVTARALRKADLVVAIAPFQKHWLRKELGVESQVLPTLLPRWINEDPESGQGGRERRGLVFLGRVVPEKGIPDLVQAAAMARDGGWCGSIDLFGPGDPELVHDMAGQIRFHGLEGSVAFQGEVDEADIPDVLQRYRRLVYPSYVDTYPLVLLEALALGLEVLCYRLPGAEEIVNRFGSGKLFEPGDVAGLAGEISSPTSLCVGETGSVVSELRWDAVVREMVTALEGVA